MVINTHFAIATYEIVANTDRETVARRTSLLAAALLIMITGCASTASPERAGQSLSSRSLPETLPMSDEEWQATFLTNVPSTPVETSVFSCAFAAKAPIHDILVGHSDPLGDDLVAAGKPTPSQADRDWALAARREQLLGDCERRYGPQIRITPPDIVVDVEGRDTAVDLGAGSVVAIPLTPGNTLSRASWDLGHRYVIVELEGTFHHHCGVSDTAIEALALAEDVDAHYQSVDAELGNCPMDGVPDYSQNFPAGEWLTWSETVHAAIASDVEFDPHPMAYAKQLSEIAGELIRFCVSYRGREIDLDEFNRSLGVTTNEAQFKTAQFRYRVAEEYNGSSEERRMIC